MKIFIIRFLVMLTITEAFLSGIWIYGYYHKDISVKYQQERTERRLQKEGR